MLNIVGGRGFSICFQDITLAYSVSFQLRFRIITATSVKSIKCNLVFEIVETKDPSKEIGSLTSTRNINWVIAVVSLASIIFEFRCKDGKKARRSKNIFCDAFRLIKSKIKYV